MSPLLDHTWFLVVISSNDRAILYSYRDIARYYVKNRKNFPTPRINYRVDLRHYLTDPYQIWWTYRLIITHWWTLLFSIFYFPSTLRVTAHNMLRLYARLGEIWGFSPLSFVRGHFYEIGIAALLFRVKPRHVAKFRKYRFADVGKKELGKK